MKPNIVFLDRDTTDRGDMDLTALEALGDLTCHGITRPDETADRIADAEIVLTNKVIIGPAEMDRAPELKLIQAVATGVNNIDIGAAKERGLAVCNVSGYSTESVAQHVFACLLNLETNVHRFAAEPEKWAASPMFTRLDYPVGELAGKTFGIVGLGAIGKAVARIAEAFGMTVIAYAREGAAPASGDIDRIAHDDFFESADVVSLHCPLTPETKHFINADSLQRMGANSILINTGRGDLIDEPALVAALKDGTILAAAIDVLTPEPPPADHPFLDPSLADRLFITPHTAWSPKEARQRLLNEIVENLLAFQAGKERNRIV